MHAPKREIHHQAGRELPTMRSVVDLHAMALAVQENLARLLDEETRRRDVSLEACEIRVSLPPALSTFRETLIDDAALRAYSPAEVQFRLREMWGRCCLFAWLFRRTAREDGVDFHEPPDDAELRCQSEVEAKYREVHAMLWRLRFEQQARQDHEFSSSTDYQRKKWLAQTIPVILFGKDLIRSTEEELLLGACEHAGMLGTLRWILDRDLRWDAPGIMEAADQPFPHPGALS